MRKVETRILTIAMGMLVVLGIVFSQILYFPPAITEKNQVKTEQGQSEDSENQIYVSVASTSLPSSTHLELNPNVFLLFEILFEEEAFIVPDFNFFIPSGQFFRTLFGVTISPNAP
jgi:hypothetical protein